ncbi:MAG: hypothetical protein ACPGU1_19470 [Myxococcota bacterium]
MLRVLFVSVWVVCASACASDMSDAMSEDGQAPASGKGDLAEVRDADWANGFFLTQIYDAEWNPEGVVDDIASNNCGPASLAMLMAERGGAPALEPEQAIDHARALMYPGYPEIDPALLAEEATLYVEGALTFVDDDAHPVYLEPEDASPSLHQGIVNSGGNPVLGSSWGELDALLEAHGGVIAYGHITEGWRSRFSEDYGTSNEGAVPHFIALFPASELGQFIVCDPMHRGGAVMMDQATLGAFFQSPVNVYDTTIRLIAWEAPTEEVDEVPVVEEEVVVDPYAMALDVHAHRVVLGEDAPAEDYQRPPNPGGFSLSGTEFWQKWAGGESPTYQFAEGTEAGRRCMIASGKRFEAILADPPQGLLTLRLESKWSGSFFNWNDDYSQSDWGDGQSARLWAWKTGLIKWISQTSKDGSCYLPTLEMVEALAERCLEQAVEDEGEIVGCSAS